MDKRIKHSLYVGQSKIRGVLCHHLSFDGDNVQLQVWIDAGDKPLPQKVVLTHKNLPGSPQWTAYLSDWNFSPQLTKTCLPLPPLRGPKRSSLSRSQPARPRNPGRRRKKKEVSHEAEKLKSPFWSLFVVALLVGLPFLGSEAQAYRGGGGGYHGGGGFSGGSFRGGGGYAEGPRGRGPWRKAPGGSEYQTAHGGAAYKGPHGGEAAKGRYGGEAARGPYGGAAARGPGGETAYRQGSYHGGAYHGGAIRDLPCQPDCDGLRELERLLWPSLRWCRRRGGRRSGSGCGSGGFARRGRRPVSGGSETTTMTAAPITSPAIRALT